MAASLTYYNQLHTPDEQDNPYLFRRISLASTVKSIYEESQASEEETGLS
jgi:hypothetical protein